MEKLCIIYNFAQHYRTNIFSLIDQEFDCDFVFGDSMSDVKKMDYALLHGTVTETHTQWLGGGWYYQPKVVSMLFADYSHYILLGETRALSTWLFCILARMFFPKKKVYFWSHGWYGKETRMEKFIKKILFRLPNAGVFLYGNYARELMVREGFNPDKLFVIHNSLAYDKQLGIRHKLSSSDIYYRHFGNSCLNLIFIGRLTKVKRLDLLMEALLELKKNGCSYNLTLVGDGSEKENLQNLVRNYDLGKNVWFYGACYDEMENAELIYNADLCVSPGNVGLTAMHSLMFGTPVITHDNFPYQMPEFEAIHQGVTGDFFEMGNADSLAECISGWFDRHESDRDRVREACYKEIDTSWNPYFQIGVIKKYLRV